MSKTRGFEFHVYSDNMNLLDKFNLDLVTSPSGLGFAQQVTVIQGETVDYIVKRALRKQDIKLTIEFEEPNSYTKVNALRSWLAEHINDKLVLYYNDTERERLMDIYVKEYQVTEIVTNFNSIPVTLTPLSPFYRRGSQKTTVTQLGNSKQYPYQYPYSYGGTSLENKELNNTYFAKIPLFVKIYGNVTYPMILLKDENDNTYSTVSFPQLIIGEGQYLIIDAVNSRILLFNGVEEVDYYNYVDKQHDSFLFAQPGKTIIDANFSTTDTGYIEITYTQYIV